MQEEFDELRQAIAGDLDAKLDTKLAATERRLRESLSKDITTGIEASAGRLRQSLSLHIGTSIEASENRLRQNLTQELTRQLETAQQHLEGRMKVHAEKMKELVTKAAEGYGGTLDGIQRELKGFRDEFRVEASDTDRILDNHASRIVALEQTGSGD